MALNLIVIKKQYYQGHCWQCIFMDELPLTPGNHPKDNIIQIDDVLRMVEIVFHIDRLSKCQTWRSPTDDFLLHFCIVKSWRKTEENKASIYTHMPPLRESCGEYNGIIRLPCIAGYLLDDNYRIFKIKVEHLEYDCLCKGL